MLVGLLGSDMFAVCTCCLHGMLHGRRCMLHGRSTAEKHLGMTQGGMATWHGEMTCLPGVRIHEGGVYDMSHHACLECVYRTAAGRKWGAAARGDGTPAAWGPAGGNSGLGLVRWLIPRRYPGTWGACRSRAHGGACIPQGSIPEAQGSSRGLMSPPGWGECAMGAWQRGSQPSAASATNTLPTLMQ